MAGNEKLGWTNGAYKEMMYEVSYEIESKEMNQIISCKPIWFNKIYVYRFLLYTFLYILNPTNRLTQWQQITNN